MKIKLNYIARVEGEGSVKLEIKDGKLHDLKLNIWEPPRFFEGFLQGRKFDEVPDIVARICGICPVSHMTTAIRALQKALSITPSPQALKLQRIMALSQLVSSHIIHLYILALPDYHKLDSAVDMLPEFKKEIKRMLEMKEVLNSITAAFGGGRALHPVAMVVAGFTATPSRNTAGKLIKQLKGIKKHALETLRMTAALPFPEFTGYSEYACLKHGDDYALNAGRIVSSKGLDAPEEDYLLVFEEREGPYSNAKRTIIKNRSASLSQGAAVAPLMVGALARVNLKFDMLHEDAKGAAALAGFNPPSDNPFLNNLAQALEIVHGVSELIELLDELSPERPWVDIKVKEGEGSALTEAPRGLLYHYYSLDRMGIVTRANIVTPTAHNFLSLEENLRKLVKEHIDEPRKEITLKCEMLVRAYDPCFSCSVH